MASPEFIRGERNKTLTKTFNQYQMKRYVSQRASPLFSLFMFPLLLTLSAGGVNDCLWKSELEALLCTEHEIFIKSSHFEKACLFSELDQQNWKAGTWSFRLVFMSDELVTNCW